MKMYDYLIAYEFSKEGFLTVCTGTIQISQKKKIKTFEDVNYLIKYIENNIEGAYNVAINNIILLGRNKH